MPSAALSSSPRPAVTFIASAAHAWVRLRLVGTLDADGLGDALSGAWRNTAAGRRTAARVLVSIVETCGRTPPERERDALRLLQAESDTPHAAGTIHATLVRIDDGAHLLQLSARPDANTPLHEVAEALAQRYPRMSVEPA